jgi:signal transduction histidine kinase
VSDADELVRLSELIDVVVGIASNDFSRRAQVGDGRALLDGLAAGLNMLAEEVGRQARREAEYRVRLVRAERLAAVGQLAAGIAHEVNNPAAFVLLNLLTLDERLGAAAGRGMTGDELAAALDLVRETRTGVERIVALVRDLRQFSRIDDERFVPVAIAEVVELAARPAAHQPAAERRARRAGRRADGARRHHRCPARRRHGGGRGA